MRCYSTPTRIGNVPWSVRSRRASATEALRGRRSERPSHVIIARVRAAAASHSHWQKVCRYTSTQHYRSAILRHNLAIAIFGDVHTVSDLRPIWATTTPTNASNHRQARQSAFRERLQAHQQPRSHSISLLQPGRCKPQLRVNSLMDRLGVRPSSLCHVHMRRYTVSRRARMHGGCNGGFSPLQASA